MENLKIVETLADSINDVEKLTGVVSVGTLCLDDCMGLQEIKLVGYAFEEISLEGTTGLTSIELNGVSGNVGILDFTGYKNVETLTLAGLDQYGLDGELNVKELILKDMPALTDLGVACRAMEQLDVSEVKNLQRLSVGDVTAFWQSMPESPYPLQKLILGEQQNLDSLTCRYTEIKELDLSDCPNIRALVIDNNKNLSGINGQIGPKLLQLDCSDTKIRDLDTSKSPALVYLDCSNTEIKDLDVSKAAGLTLLSIANTDITGVTFAPEITQCPLVCYMRSCQKMLL